MDIPAQYAWLAKIPVLPKVISEGLKLLGTLETPGPASNPTIMAWRNELVNAGVSVVGFSADSVPWCGLFAAVVVLRAGKTPVKAPLWAANWRHFGEAADQASLGDVLVFQRPGGGHVGFYVADDHDCFHVLGGNQHDSVSIVRIAKTRCVAMRRPPYLTKPDSVKPYHVASSGTISTNEA